MGFVVEKIPFGEEIVGFGSGPVIGVTKSFNTSAEYRIAFEEINSTFPNNFTDFKTTTATITDALVAEINDFLGGLGETVDL